MVGKKEKAKAVVAAFFGLTLAIFLLGGGANRARFLAALGLAPDPPSLVSWYAFENATAVNLASEGIEAIKTIRNNNWFKYPHNGEHCWLMLPKNSSTDECAAPHLIQNGLYVLEYSIDTPWQLKLIGTEDSARLDLSAGHPDVNEQYRARFITDYPSGMAPDIMGIGPTTTLARPENDAVFFRMIQIQTDENSPPKMIELNSIVQWKSGEKIYETSLSTSLTNYQTLTS